MEALAFLSRNPRTVSLVLFLSASSANVNRTVFTTVGLCILIGISLTYVDPSSVVFSIPCTVLPQGHSQNSRGGRLCFRAGWRFRGCFDWQYWHIFCIYNGLRYWQEPHATKFVKSLRWLLSNARFVGCVTIEKSNSSMICPKRASGVMTKC